MRILTNTLFASVLVALPILASAHEHQTFRIGDKTYEIGIGSVGEPVIVDDKSGVELSVTLLPATPAVAHDDAVAHEEVGTPVSGLEQTLKVEVRAGDAKKMFDLSPVYGKAGSYKTTFFPTVQTTLSYRLIGTMNSVPVDLTFTCNPAGHAKSPDWTGDETLGDKVSRLSKTGSFGCPSAKADFGFPEPSASITDLKSEKDGVDLGLVGTILGAIACVLALRRRKA